MICIFDCPPIEFFYNISIFTYNKIKRTVLSVCPSDSTYVFLAFELFFRNEKKMHIFLFAPLNFENFCKFPQLEIHLRARLTRSRLKTLCTIIRFACFENKSRFGLNNNLYLIKGKQA